MKTNKWFGNQFRSSLYIRVKRGLGSVVGGYVKIASMLTLVYVVALLGAKYLNVPVYAQIETIKEVQIEAEFPPILTKICFAESGGKQFNKNGSVVRGKTTPSDIGYCQIAETIWNDKARELGYDIYTLEGNKGFALWLFNHYGSEPWYLSKHNWK